MLVLRGEGARGKRDTKKEAADRGKRDENTGHSEVPGQAEGLGTTAEATASVARRGEPGRT